MYALNYDKPIYTKCKILHHSTSLAPYINEELVLKATQESCVNTLFWTPGLPEGVLSNRPCPLVSGPWSVRLLVRL